MESFLSITAKRKYENKRSRNRKFSNCAYWLLAMGCVIYLSFPIHSELLFQYVYTFQNQQTQLLKLNIQIIFLVQLIKSSRSKAFLICCSKSSLSELVFVESATFSIPLIFNFHCEKLCYERMNIQFGFLTIVFTNILL